MERNENCGVCGRRLIYSTQTVELTCEYCGRKAGTLIFCPQGHYVCDSCHQRDALDILRGVLGSLKSSSPAEIVERVMSHPRVPMHGPEHHAIVPAAIIAAVRNSGYPVPDDAIEKAVARGTAVPGGWCGSHGSCGAAVGVGIAISVLTEATPLTGPPRSMANEATAYALTRMVDGLPRCCKRASRNAISAAIDFLRAKTDIELVSADTVRCTYPSRNRECARKRCPYYDRKSSEGRREERSREVLHETPGKAPESPLQPAQ